jgi:predicted AAA+ superfamily ATPase
MKRMIESQLIEWKQRSDRKPLLVQGIRQVGKTWILKDFGGSEFENIVYINFDIEPALKEIFIRSKDPATILFELSILIGKKIEPSKTFIFLDEIQECNEALNALKYFDEADEAYYIVGAGSYLGITLSKGLSFPVGKVEILNMYPMTFKEFLVATGEKLLVDYMESINKLIPISEPILDKMNHNLKKYYIVGGMPEAVKTWIQSEDVEKVSQVQRNILNAYYRDFSKYPPVSMVPKIVGIWESMVGQLSRENRNTVKLAKILGQESMKVLWSGWWQESI